jgi:hypothetical protein
MKILIKICLIVFCFSLSSISSFAQNKIKCTQCKNGVSYWTERLVCKNCKDWADSYRKIRGCDVCKNNQFIKLNKQSKCKVCKGTGWRLPDPVVPPTKKQLIYQRLKDLGLEPQYHPYFYLNDETQLEIAKYRIKNGTESDIWPYLACIMTGDCSYSAVKSKIYALLDYYEFYYEDSPVKNSTREIYTSPFRYEPSPKEIILIKKELNELNLDPNYQPRFFSIGITGVDLLRWF